MEYPLTDAAEFVSLVLTVPTVLLSAMVVWVFVPRAIRALRYRRPKDFTEVELLIAGIVIGFAGAFFDNIYWFLAWGAEFFHLPQRDWLFRNGVWSNIPFRQVAGSTAAILHLWAALKMADQKDAFVRAVRVITGVTAATIIAIKAKFSWF